ncbi:VWA domain-containing protein [Brevibacillus sp. SYSU BS000544]|uniref:VWA domain-containing protein n=1 Tax=Brevibacillus sp. SYSU BS000544 TaxID=3416443 RepID=UPI003CE50AC6
MSKQKKRKYFPLVAGIISLACTLSFTQFVPPISAAQSNAKYDLDVVVVVDNSNSMNQADEDKTVTEAVKMFVDLSESNSIRLGLVEYNDEIIASHPLTSLADKQNTSKIKQVIQDIRYYGYSDLGLGLRKGNELLTQEKEASRKQIMILLTDGGIHLNPQKKQRKISDSHRDITQVLDQAKAIGYPIYTIGLQQTGSDNQALFEQITSESGGALYFTKHADEMATILQKIYAKETNSVFSPLSTVMGTGKQQKVTVPIPHSSMRVGKIVLWSKGSIQKPQLVQTANQSSLTQSRKYTMIRSEKPQQGTLDLLIRANPGEAVTVSMISTTQLEAVLHLPAAPLLKGDLVPITATLISETNAEPIADEKLIEGLTAELLLADMKTKSAQKITMQKDGSQFLVNHEFPTSGEYEGQVIVSGPFLHTESSPIPLKITNSLPSFIGPGTVSVAKEDGTYQVDLDKLFTDQNHDVLAYSVLPGNAPENIRVDLAQNLLSITPLHTGKISIPIKATDQEGAAASTTLEITVHSIWDRYFLIGVFVLLGLVLIRIAYGVIRRPQFTGRLEAYFLQTASGNEMPVKYWPLNSFSHKRKITLHELFLSLDVFEHLPETENIYLIPGKKGTILLINKTECIITKRNSNQSTYKKEILKHNDVVNIVFEDGLTEIYLRYEDTQSFATSYTEWVQAETYR